MKKIASALALGAAMVLGAARADASITVDFTIVGNVSEPGTITGHLLFDSAGTGVRATGVYIDSAPDRFFLFADDNLVAGLHAQANAFTVTADGTVTSANLYLFGNAYLYGGDPAQSSAGVTGNAFELNDFGYNSYSQEFAYPYPFGSSFSAVSNQGGFAGATFAAAATPAVPEPAAWTTLILGAGAVGFALRRRRAVRTTVAFG